MSETIEVGASEGDFRLCKAIFTRVAAEAYLVGQERNFTCLESRATNLLGWTVAGAVALTSQMLIAGFNAPLVVASVVLLASAAAACGVLWPKEWHHSGFPPEVLSAWPETTELELQEGAASGYGEAIRENNRIAKRASGLMRAAWLLAFAAAPLAVILHIIYG